MEEKATKVCTKCGKEKPISEFGLNIKMADGHKSECKECAADYAREYYHRRRRGEDTSTSHLNKVYFNPELAKFHPKNLIAELRARGYSGEFKYTQTIKI